MGGPKTDQIPFTYIHSLPNYSLIQVTQLTRFMIFFKAISVAWSEIEVFWSGSIVFGKKFLTKLWSISIRVWQSRQSLRWNLSLDVRLVDRSEIGIFWLDQRIEDSSHHQKKFTTELWLVRVKWSCQSWWSCLILAIQILGIISCMYVCM